MAPPSVFDFNRIEQTFAKIKHRMRRTLKRSVEDAWRHVGHAIEPDECRNAFASLIGFSQTRDASA
jgi:transposase